MPRTRLPVTGLSKAAPAAPTETAADVASGNAVPNDGQTMLAVRNTSSSARTLTIAIQATVDGQPYLSKVHSVPAGATRYIGPFPVGWYGNVLQLDASSADLVLAAMHFGTDLAAGGGDDGGTTPPPAVSPFTYSGNSLYADDTAPGVSYSSGSLFVDDQVASGVSYSGGSLYVTTTP